MGMIMTELRRMFFKSLYMNEDGVTEDEIMEALDKNPRYSVLFTRSLLKDLLETNMELGRIDKEREGNKYFLTEKGKNYYNNFDDIETKTFCAS